jgi:hypothetical protein
VEGEGGLTIAQQRRFGLGRHHLRRTPKLERPQLRRDRPKPNPVTGEAPAAPPTAISAAAAPVPVTVAVSAPAPTPAPAAPLRLFAQPVAAAIGPAPQASRAPSRIASAPAAPTGAATPAAPAAPAPALETASPRTTPASTAAPVSRASAHGGSSPLITTVTRIIGVVPAPVWALIAALAFLALAFAASSRLGARRVRRLARQRAELLEDVGLLQAALLPAIPSRLGPVGTTAAYRPASGPGAGGDFYDLFALGDGRLAVILGDVSGHGRSALPHTTLVRFTLRAYLEAGLSPRDALKTAAGVLERALGESFATVVLATYHPRERTLVYACAGHPPPVLSGAAAIDVITACAAPPIGVGQPTGTRQTVVSLPGESLVCFFTDGVIESRISGELFGEGRLRSALAELGGDATASGLLDRVAEESESRPDDMAACLLRVEGDGRAPVVRLEELVLDRREAAGERVARFLRAGGLDDGEVGEVMRSVRSATAAEGRVVLELRLSGGSPEVLLRRDNVAAFTQPARATAHPVWSSR